MGAGNVFLTSVVPVFGNVLGAIMLLSPTAAVLSVRRTRQLGAINPLPYPLTAINCMGWVAYGIVISNLYLIPANIVGMMAGIVFTMFTFPHATRKVQDIITAVLLYFTLHFCVLGTITSIVGFSDKTAMHVWGTNAVAILCMYYGAPLSTLTKVITTKNAASLYPPLAIAAVANGSLWTAYGLAVKDVNVWLPNFLGAIIGVLQLVLRAVYGAREVPEANHDDHNGHHEASTGLLSGTSSAMSCKVEEPPPPPLAITMPSAVRLSPSATRAASMELKGIFTA